MSANIYFHPVRPTLGVRLYTDTPSHDLSLMRDVLGKEPPCVLDRGDLPVLRGMAGVAESGNDNRRSIWGLIVVAIEKHDAIEITVVY